MKIDCQDYLDMAEKAKNLVFFDIESNGLNADYNSTLVVSFKPYGEKPYSMTVKQVGNDQKLVREVRDELAKYHCWVSYYGKGFDVKFLNTRLLKWGLRPLDKRHHIDLYFVLKAHTKMSSKSMARFASLLNLDEQKMSVSPNVWSEFTFKPEHLDTMVQRCESDVSVLEELYKHVRHLIRDIKVQD